MVIAYTKGCFPSNIMENILLYLVRRMYFGFFG